METTTISEHEEQNLATKKTLIKPTREGFSAFTYPNKTFRYVGKWDNNKLKHGHGTFYIGAFPVYEGNFVNGEISGHGLRRFQDGSTFSGSFYMGHMHGQGVYIGANGDHYEGEYEFNQRSGQGVLTFANGDVYRGGFKKHRRDGEGSMVYEDLSTYTGSWVDNVREGHGEAKWCNGDIYKGQWRADTRHGTGSFSDTASGITYSGIWINDSPAEVPTHLSLYNPAPPIDAPPPEAQPAPIPTPVASARSKLGTGSKENKAHNPSRSSTPVQPHPPVLDDLPRIRDISSIAPLAPLEVRSVVGSSVDAPLNTAETGRVVRLTVLALQDPPPQQSTQINSSAAGPGTGDKSGRKVVAAAETPVDVAKKVLGPPIFSYSTKVVSGIAVFEDISLPVDEVRPGLYNFSFTDVTGHCQPLVPCNQIIRYAPPAAPTGNLT